MKRTSIRVRIISALLVLAIAVPMASACGLRFIGWFAGSAWQTGECYADPWSGCSGTCQKTVIVSPVCEVDPYQDDCPGQDWITGPTAFCEDYGGYWEPGILSEARRHLEQGWTSVLGRHSNRHSAPVFAAGG